MFMSTIRDPNQRSTILDVLLRYGMIADVKGTLRATPEGMAFLVYIGLI